jgi:hypothetical protein
VAQFSVYDEGLVWESNVREAFQFYKIDDKGEKKPEVFMWKHLMNLAGLLNYRDVV